MLAGNWLMNLIVSLLAFVTVFAASVAYNLVETSLFRGVYAFISVFFLMYVFRWLWALASKSNEDIEAQQANTETDDVDSTETVANDQLRNDDNDEETSVQTAAFVKDLLNDKGD
ncbi:hypothetical protein [Desertibacillus haloalkaliphilus]|uniref:hypothetical protein n=1 Tax=Desertibacillus haloalkaliphilus TaxID=1328930 RepID=UPI001C2758F3|nr:hypothetical protein [Desertibacillus haloalkaliphilus]MBU8906989.1 hypothetical protein [Desertibacillus haloalkaliphilus]